MGIVGGDLHEERFPGTHDSLPRRIRPPGGAAETEAGTGKGFSTGMPVTEGSCALSVRPLVGGVNGWLPGSICGTDGRGGVPGGRGPNAPGSSPPSPSARARRTLDARGVRGAADPFSTQGDRSQTA
jgi:hypothetical protein